MGRPGEPDIRDLAPDGTSTGLTVAETIRGLFLSGLT